MKVIAIVQSRCGSTRLPGKALMPVAGRPLLQHVLERAMRMQTVAQVVLATTWDDRDTALAELAGRMGLIALRGSTQDVLGRFKYAAKAVEADIIVRITGDCPLYAPDIGDNVVTAFLGGARNIHDAYAWNDTTTSGFPDGTDVEVFSYMLLAAADAQTRGIDPAREHVTAPIRKIAGQILTVKAGMDLTHLKLSVDRPEDYERVRRVYGFLSPQKYEWPDTLAACRSVGLV